MLTYACVVVSLSMAALFIIVQTRRVFFLIVCLFLSKLLFCTLCAKVISMQVSQNVHNGHLSNHTLPEKAKSFHLLMGFQYTESACDQVRVKYWKMLAVWMPRSSALFVFAVLFIELNLLLIQMDPHIYRSLGVQGTLPILLKVSRESLLPKRCCCGVNLRLLLYYMLTCTT